MENIQRDHPKNVSTILKVLIFPGFEDINALKVTFAPNLAKKFNS